MNILNLYQVDLAIFLPCPQLDENHCITYNVYLPKDTFMNIIFLVHSWVLSWLIRKEDIAEVLLTIDFSLYVFCPSQVYHLNYFFLQANIEIGFQFLSIVMKDEGQFLWMMLCCRVSSSGKHYKHGGGCTYTQSTHSTAYTYRVTCGDQ